MQGMIVNLRGAVIAAVLGVATLAGGCGGIDGIELQGGVFDALGLSGSGEKKPEPKVAARPGLVLPPNDQRLPAPGEGQQVAGGDWPLDPEENKVRAKAELEKRHKEYCEQALRNARLKGETGVVMGPQGNCQSSLLGSLTSGFESVKGR